MTQFIITLSEDYEIPENIKQIHSNEWETILSSLSEMFSLHNDVKMQLNNQELHDTIAEKYSNEIKLLNETLKDKDKELEKLTTMQEKLLKSQRKDLELYYTSLFNEKLQLLNETSEKRNNRIDSLNKEIEELNNILNTYQNSKIIPLQKQIDEYHIKINELRNNNIFEKNNLINIYEEKYKKYEDDINNKLLQQQNEYEKKLQALTKTNEETSHHIITTKNETIELLKNQITELQKNNEPLRKKIEELQNKYNHKLEDLQNSYAIKIQESQNTYEEKYNLQIEQINLQKNETIELLKNQITELQKITNENYNQKIHDNLIQKLDPIIKFYGGTNSEKGEGGEQIIREILQKETTYSTAIIEDVSNQTATGDIIFTWNKLKCLIEVKNKQRITKGDIEKFERDVIQSIEDLNINCAIFASLQTNIIPGKSREIVQLEYINGIPILYIYLPPPYKEIHFAIATLEKIIEFASSSINNNEEIIKHFEECYATVINYKKYFDIELQKRQHEIKALHKHLEHFTKLCEQISPLYTRLQSSENPEIETEEAPSEISEVETENKKNTITLSEDPNEQLDQLAEEFIAITIKNHTPTIQMLSTSFNVSNKVIESIKLNTIANHARQLFLQKHITDDKLQSILDYYNLHKQFPTRKELITNKIFNEYTLRIMNKMFKSKKITDVISDFCQSSIQDSP